MNEPGWQDPTIVTLGTFVFAVPWLLPSTFGDPMAGDTMAWALLLTGLATGLIAVAGIVLPDKWEALIEFALGIWLMVLPWVVEPFTEPTAATWAAPFPDGVVCGVPVDADVDHTRHTDCPHSLHRKLSQLRPRDNEPPHRGRRHFPTFYWRRKRAGIRVPASSVLANADGNPLSLCNPRTSGEGLVCPKMGFVRIGARPPRDLPSGNEIAVGQ